MGLSNKVWLAAKVESTYGTDPVPTGAANSMLIGSLELKPIQGETVERNIIRPYFGAVQGLLVTSYATASFEVEIAASGTAGTAPQYSPLLKACGFSETIVATTSVTYAPITPTTLTDANTSATLYFNKGGIQHIMLGARGTVTFDMTAKKIPVMKFSFTGLLGTITDAALPTATYTAYQPVPVNTANTVPTITLNGAFASPIVETISFDVGNEVKYRNLIGAEMVIIGARKTKGSITIQAPTIATKDFFSASRTNAVGTLSVMHGTVAGNKVQISSATNGFDPDVPDYKSTDGVDMLQIPFTLLPIVGNDEFTITLT